MSFDKANSHRAESFVKVYFKPGLVAHHSRQVIVNHHIDLTAIGGKQTEKRKT